MTATKPYVLGISISHNGSACLLHGDKIHVAIQEERLLRWKRAKPSARYMRSSIEYCLRTAGIKPNDLTLVAIARVRDPRHIPAEDIYLNEYLRVGHHKTEVLEVPHHLGHAYSAYATSGFRKASIMVIDGAGSAFAYLPPEEKGVVLNTNPADGDLEWLSWYEGINGKLVPAMKQLGRPHQFDRAGVADFASIGDMYGAVGAHIFSDFLDGPGKVMGLAPYGKPTIAVEQWFSINSNGLFDFRPDGFEVGRASCHWPRDFDACANFAASVQQATEFGILDAARRISQRSSTGNLCYAGGVALNSVANEKLIREGIHGDVYIYPAAEDSGVAVGAAFYGLSRLATLTPKRLDRDSMGRSYSTVEIGDAIDRTPCVARDQQPCTVSSIVSRLCKGDIVGWFLDGSELGPRALGYRSILCDPRRSDAKDVLNHRVKHRESYRPFAPVILQEHVPEWFDVPRGFGASPFMLRVMKFREDRARHVPAVCHVDLTGRVQTLTEVQNPKLHQLLSEFYRETKIPILLNTSLNIAGEPIVETPEDALWCLLCTGLDHMVFNAETLVSKENGFSSILDFAFSPVLKGLVTYHGVANGRIPNLLQLADLPIRALNPYDRSALASLYGLISPKDSPYGIGWAESMGPSQGIYRLLTPRLLDILRSLDGKATGRELLSAIAPGDEATMIRTLGSLYRAGLIRPKARIQEVESLNSVKRPEGHTASPQRSVLP